MKKWVKLKADGISIDAIALFPPMREETRLVPEEGYVETDQDVYADWTLKADGVFEPPPPPPPPPPPSSDPRDYDLRRWEFLAMVDVLQVEARIEAAIDAIPDEFDRAIARQRAWSSETYHRGDALFDQLAPKVGVTPAAIDAAWMQIVRRRPGFAG